MKHVSPGRYSVPAQTLHWLTAILVLAAFILGPGGSEQHIYAASQDLGRETHETIGLSVFVLTFIRLFWRAFDTRPPAPDLAAWMEKAAKVVQLLLYILLFAVPLTAITGAWLEGHDLTLLAGIRITPLFVKAHGVGSVVIDVHTWLGDTIIWIAGLHACAGLFHHYVLRDSVLRSMLPRWFMKEQA